MDNTWAGALVEVRGVVVIRGERRIVDDIQLTVEPRRWTAILGPNGAGKSTLLRSLAGLIKHDGAVLIDGNDVGAMSARDRAAQIAYAPQTPTMPALMTVRDYVMLGRNPYRAVLAGPRRRDHTVVTDVLDRLDVAVVADRRLRTLSGGERQRVVLARALAQQPRLLLLGEPTAALDLGHAQQVLELVDDLRRDHGLTVITTLHDLMLAGQYAERIVLLNGGRVAADGAPGTVLTRDILAENYDVEGEVDAGADGVRVYPARPSRVPARV